MMGAMLYGLIHRVVAPLSKAVWRPDVTGLENVPPTGGVIMASNHLSFVDSVVIPVVVPRKVAFLAKKDYFERHGHQGLPHQGVVRRHRHAAGRPRRPAGRDQQPEHRARGGRQGRGVRHLSRGDRAAATAGSTGAAPVPPTWPSLPAYPSCRWQCTAPRS